MRDAKGGVTLSTFKLELASAAPAWVDDFVRADGFGAVAALLSSAAGGSGGKAAVAEELDAAVGVAEGVVNAVLLTDRKLEAVIESPAFVAALAQAFGRAVVDSVLVAPAAETARGVPTPALPAVPASGWEEEGLRMRVRTRTLMLLTVVAGESEAGLGVVADAWEDMEHECHVSKQFGALVEVCALPLPPPARAAGLSADWWSCRVRLVPSRRHPVRLLCSLQRTHAHATTLCRRLR